MASPTPPAEPGQPAGPPLRAATVGALVLLLLTLFHGVLSPSHVLFSNDGPLGVISAASGRLPGAFFGVWQDLNWVGNESPSATPNVTQIAGTLAASPTLFARFYAPGSLLLLGLAAAFCFRCFGFSGPVALLGAIAAGLNANFLSHACWGLPTRALGAACILTALGLALRPGARPWIRIVLAGFAVGVNVTEAADTGALLSLYVAAALLWEEFSSPSRPWPARIGWGAGKVLLLALAAGWIAYGSISTLVATSVKGVAVFQENQSSDQRWEFVTGWSFPKAETLRLLIPGVMGYRMDTPDGGAYWGGVGPDGDPRNRFSGGGEYAGVLVLLGAAWAITRALSRSPDSPFTPAERRRVLFWAAAALVSLLLAFGRHAPFYHLIFPLPFFRTMRIPMKFLHGFHLAALILFAHGLEALAREHLRRPGSRLVSWGGQVKAWWSSPRTPAAERNFGRAIGIVLAATALGLVTFASYRPALLTHLGTLAFDPATAAQVFNRSLSEILIFATLLATFGLLFIVAFAGGFNGTRARNLWWILGVLLAVDLFRANTPWIQHYDYQRRYRSNAVVDFLKANPAESRVAFRLLPTTRQLLLTPDDGAMTAVHNLWLEHHFQFYNIQTVDIIQAPRMPALDQAFLENFSPGTNEMATGDFHRVGRFWQLSATRYFMAARAYEGQLNQSFAPPGGPLVPRLTFDLTLRSDAQRDRLQPDDFDAVASPKGRYALYELTGSLPRVRLFSQWQVQTNDPAALATLRDPAFNPLQSVVLATDPGLAANPADAPVGEAKLESYAPKKLVVRTQAKTASVLLDNDRWHEDWHVYLDGQPAPLLRANHLMRGVAIPAGEHRVEFRFEPDARPLYISLAAVVTAVALTGFLAFTGRRPNPDSPTPSTTPAPNPKPSAKPQSRA